MERFQILEQYYKNYATGEITLKFNKIVERPILVTYTKNQITMPRYTNFSTLTFKIATDSIKPDAQRKDQIMGKVIRMRDLTPYYYRNLPRLSSNISNV